MRGDSVMCLDLSVWRAKCLLGQRGKLPELGFTRSIGDLMWLGVKEALEAREAQPMPKASRYKKYGVTARPEVYKLEQAPKSLQSLAKWRRHEFEELGDGSGHFLLGSDGIWEFLSNEDVAEIVHRSST